MPKTTNSPNDALGFCLVLLVEIFGLSVALGGPWIEVSYFLLVVISQTIAGVYIWAQLRKNELQLPIPELLAMGFAIGSSTAAISQLILRDLLGIRLLISPYVPIIAVAIWLISRRSPRLAVKITHTDSTTLLWLLFPAPLAFSHYVWLLFPSYLAPLLLFIFLCRRQMFVSLIDSIRKVFIVATILLSVFTNYVISTLTNVSQALWLATADLLFDVGHSVTFTNFGFDENIAMAGQNFQYYKFPHLWLGPILMNTTAVGITVATTFVPLLFFLMIGLALWTLTHYFSSSNRAANIASVLFFALATLPEPILLEIRIAYLFPYFVLICGGVLILKYSIVRSVTALILISLTSFVVTYSRIFLYPTLMVFFMVGITYEPRRILQGIKSASIYLSASLFGSSVAIYLTLFALDPVLRPHITQVPIVSSLVSFVTATMPYLLIIIFGRKFSTTNHKIYIFTFGAAFVSGLLQLFGRREYPSSTSYLLPLIIYLASVIAVLIDNEFSSEQVSRTTYTKLAGIGSIFGFVYGYSYFVRQYISEEPSSPLKIYWKLFLQQSRGFNVEYAALRLQIFEIVCILLITTLVKLVIPRFSLRFRNLAVVITVSVLFGNSIAVTTRQFIQDRSSTSPALFAGDGSQSRRWSNDSRMVALVTGRSLIKSGSTIATNFGNYASDGQNDTYLVPVHLRARSYLSPPYANPTLDNERSRKLISLISTRKLISINFPIQPDDSMLRDLLQSDVEWFIVDLEATELRDWEPWATTRFINEKVAILELATEGES